MKRLIALVLLAACFFGAAAQDAGNRYGIKSGIAKTKTLFGGQETYAEQYFDNYGQQESLKQRMEVPGLVSYDYYTITKGSDAWMVTATDGKKSFKRFNNPTQDLNLLNPSEEVKAKYNIKYLGDEEFFGKPCKKYSYQTTQGRRTVDWTVWTYKGFVMKSVTLRGKKEAVVEVVDFQENVAVPADVFETSAE